MDNDVYDNVFCVDCNNWRKQNWLERIYMTVHLDIFAKNADVKIT